MISFYEQNAGFYKFTVFADKQPNKTSTLDGTIFQVNKNLIVDSAFAKHFFGLSQKKMHSSQKNWETAPFIQKHYVFGKMKYRQDQKETPQWESFSYSGYPNETFKQNAGAHDFTLNVNSKEKLCQLYAVVFFLKKKPGSQNITNFNLELKFMVGADFNIADAVSRFGHNKNNLLTPTDHVEINYHIILDDKEKNPNQKAIISTEEELIGCLKSGIPDEKTLQQQYSWLRSAAFKNLSKAAYGNSNFTFTFSDRNLKCAAKQCQQGKVLKRTLYAAKDASALLDYLSEPEKTISQDKNPLTSEKTITEEMKKLALHNSSENKRATLLQSATQLMSQTIKPPTHLICRYFNSKNGCRNGEECNYIHMKK